MDTTRTRTLAWVLIGMTAGLSYGQYQLGDGRGLDANQRQGSGGLNDQKIVNTQGVYANAIITGNVAGLGGFKGSVGYTAPGEFQGRLGSEDLYGFYRQSYSSGDPLRTRLIGQTGEPSFTAGEYAPQREVVLRQGAGSTLGAVAGRGATYGAVPHVEYSAGALGRYQTMTRSPAEFNRLSAQYGQQRLALSQDSQGRVLEMTSSPLTGLSVKPLDTPAAGYGYAEPTTEAAGLTDDRPALPEGAITGRLEGQNLSAPPIVPGTSTQDRPAPDARLTLPQVALGERLGTQMLTTGYIESQPESESGTELVAVEKGIDALLQGPDTEPGADPYADLLQRIREAATQAPGGSAPESGETQPEQAGGEEQAAEGNAADRPRPKSTALAERDAIVEQAIAKLDYDIGPIDSLAGQKQTLHDEAMREAEAHMRAGRYFDAETAYERALRLSPTDPLATVGQAHAQLGAGMFVSAARTLRGLFSNHPELIAARYAPPVLPDSERLDVIAERLDGHIKSNRIATGPTMLRAYVAYQQGENSAVVAALDELQARDAEDPLLPLLRRIWVDKDAANPPGGSSSSK